MGQLNNLYVSSSYQGLLKMTDSTNGLTNTLQTVQTGDGDNSPLQMSLTEVNISGSFSVNGIIITGATSGTSGTSGQNGSSGTSGTSGSSGSSGTGFNYLGSWDNTVSYNTNDVITYNGQTYVSLQNGNLNKQPSVQPAWWTVFSAAGSSGTSGTSGTSGSSGSSGTSGSSGSSGTSGSSGSSGTSGSSGSNGSSGTSGSSGSSGTSGSNGSSGSSGTSGSSGSSGTSGTSGSSGTSGTSGGTGSSGTSGTSGTSGDSIFALTGSVWNTTRDIGVTGSVYVDGNLYNLSLNTSVQPSTYLTSSQAGQVNIIKGWNENPTAGGAGALLANYTGSLRITGSNNIVSMPQIRATGVGGGADMTGYISGSDNTIASNASGIYLNTGSLLFPKLTNNFVGANSAILMNFTTSSLTAGHPNITNNTLYAGNITINSNSGSIANISANLLNGGGITSTQNFVTNNKPSFSTNLIGGSITVNHISSSVSLNTNWTNSPLTINNHMSGSGLSIGNSVNFNNNLIVGGNSATGPVIYISGSQNSGAARAFVNNLLGGNNLVVSSSFVSSSNANLVSTIVYGSSLAVSGSHTSTTTGGSAFFGRFNATGSNQEDAQSVVFAVGTGTAAGSRRTGLLIDSGSNLTISGSLNQSGSLVDIKSPNVYLSSSVNISGSLNVNGNQNISGSLIVSGNYVATVLTADGTINSRRLHFSSNPFNTNPSSNLGAIRLNGNNDTFQITNYDTAQITTQSYIDMNVNTGSLTSYTQIGAKYAGTDTFVKTSNVNGTTTVEISGSLVKVTGNTTLTGSLAVTGNISFASGSDKTMGTFVLNGGNPGTATVSNSLVTANSLIFLTKQTNANSGNGTVSVTSKGTGTFSVTSNHNGDADTVAYLIINPS